ncbi:DUF6390 family protein [Nocardia miyunensis]|uniref:DUF6390 family protein n=1 Tax=Nocardia miyunensis TaxID=282684 RepID=UPI001FE16AA0|nr:DUF6390 family protein [Nocardia miyunensis]
MSGPRLFARYAYAPNALGYCGPPDAAAMARGTDAEIRALARQFSGVWPYLRVLARMTGIDDPLDARLVESYWLGGGIGSDVDPAAFLSNLLTLIGPIAGGYWQHLGADLSDEVAADHSFHVFGIYPWTRLLGRGPDELPLRILDNCRITPALVRARDGATLTVQARRLRWDGDRLFLSEEVPRTVEVTAPADESAADIAVGDHIALHWDHVCGRLDIDQVDRLTTTTQRQLTATNRRLHQ